VTDSQVITHTFMLFCDFVLKKYTTEIDIHMYTQLLEANICIRKIMWKLSDQRCSKIRLHYSPDKWDFSWVLINFSPISFPSTTTWSTTITLHCHL